MKGRWIVVVIVGLLAVEGVVWYRAWRSCSARNGVLVRNAFDWPACVAGPLNPQLP